MEIGLYDVDGHNFPNLALMKISAHHKNRNDNVEMLDRFKHYDIVYVSKIFGDEYSKIDETCIDADKIIYGGTGFAIKLENEKEVYDKKTDQVLKKEIEHIYPDYELYPEFTKNTAYGFLTRGCCNNCDFCIVSKKEGTCSKKVAELSEFWRGQKEIKLLDPNLLACKDRFDLLQQLADSKAKVDFTQGLDARFIDDDVVEMLKKIKVKMYHFAFDFMKNEKQITKGLETFVKSMGYNENKSRNCYVYILTNYNTTFDEDMRRVDLVRKIGLAPDIRIYRKNTAPKITRDLQRWCNNRFIYRSVDNFKDYIPRADGKKIKEIYTQYF
jgi:hypothetical protein